MSMTYGEKGVIGTTAGTTGTIAEAAGSIAVIVLSIIGLAQTTPGISIVAVAVIVLGAALLAEGGALAGEFSRLVATSGEIVSADTEISGMSLQVAGGGTALVLGILALLGVASDTVTAAAVILVGAVLLLTAGTIPQLRQLRARATGTSEMALIIGRSAMSGMAGAQFLCGVAAIVLGILALSAADMASARNLILVGLLVIGGAMTIGVTAMSGNMLRFFVK
jgi:hypothetical protein